VTEGNALRWNNNKIVPNSLFNGLLAGRWRENSGSLRFICLWWWIIKQRAKNPTYWVDEGM